jgi:mono/diheme cytochrome c family protein
MARSGCPTRADRFALASLLLAVGGCALQPQGDLSTASPGTAAASEPEVAIDPGVELPAGAGRDILLGACLGCHDLGGLELFSGFYGLDDWRTLVVTMQSHGAAIDAGEIEVLANYLALHFSPAAAGQAPGVTD